MKRRPYKGRDRFAQRARDEGYAARSVYKLEEVQRRFKLLRRNQRVVDLGCFPGSWSSYALERIGPEGVLVGVDLEAPALPGGTWIAASVYDVEPETLLEALGGPADVVLSDMAPATTGQRDADHFAQIALAERAFDLAAATLAPGGAFVTKVFEGKEAQGFQKAVKARFDKVKRVRPEAVRKQSREWFLVATGFRA